MIKVDILTLEEILKLIEQQYEHKVEKIIFYHLVETGKLKFVEVIVDDQYKNQA